MPRGTLRIHLGEPCMFKRPALTLGKVAGIEILVDRAWILFFLGLTTWLGQVTFPTLFPGWSHNQHCLLAGWLESKTSSAQPVTDASSVPDRQHAPPGRGG